MQRRITTGWVAVSLLLGVLLGILITAPATPLHAQQPEAAERHHVYIATFRGCEEVCEAFKSYLLDRGLAVDFIERSIERDTARIPELVAEVKELQPDLLVTWGTAISLGMVGPAGTADSEAYVTDIPAVYLYVADPLGAGLVNRPDMSERPNLAGANIQVPLEAQLRVMQSYQEVDRIGVVYGADELNSVAAVTALRVAASRFGIEVIEQQLDPGPEGPPLPESIAPAMQAIAEKDPDILVTVSSSFLIQNVEAYTAAAVEAGLPLFTSAELPIRQGDAMLALFASLSSIGQVAGYQAEQILREGADPATLPTPSLRRFTLLINMPVALALERYPPMLVLQIAELMD